MIKALTRLSEKEKEVLADLLETCKTLDQVPVILQMDKTLNYHQSMKNWFLAFQGETLTGVLSVFSPLDSEVEFTGCVHPDYRKQGIFNTLMAAAMEEVHSFGIGRLLFAMDRKGKSGQAVMGKKGCQLVQTEYSMVFPAEKEVGSIQPRLRVLKTGFDEVEAAARISAAAFDETLDISQSMLINGLKSNEREQYAAYLEDRMIAVVSVLVRGRTAMINGLAVKPEEQGNGYGADFLAQLLMLLLHRNLQVSLDVDSTNASAYRLYKRLGFEETEVQDYYEKRLS